MTKSRIVYMRDCRLSKHANHNVLRSGNECICFKLKSSNKFSNNSLDQTPIKICILLSVFFFKSNSFVFFANVSCICAISVCVYVNKHGDYGPHLDRKLVQQLPDHFGPAPVNAVLQQAVQACVDCTYQPSVLLSFLQSQSHTGGEVIRGKSGEHHGIICEQYNI